MPQATVSSKGQITIPVEVRRKLNLKPGDRVDFVVDRAGEVQLRPKKKPLSVEQMHAEVAAHAAGDWERIQSQKA